MIMDEDSQLLLKPIDQLYSLEEDLTISRQDTIADENITEPWWKKIFRKDLPSPISKRQETQIRQLKLLQDFNLNHQDQYNSPSFFQNLSTKISENFSVIEPYSFPSLLWQFLNSLFVLFFMFEIPMMIFFDIKTHEVQDIVILALLIFTLDIIVSLNTAIYYQGTLEYDRSKIFMYYLETCFFQDIIPIICLGTQLLPTKHLFYYIGFFFYLKLYEIFKIQENFYNNLRLKRHSIAIYQMTQLMIQVIFICHIFACLFYGIARFQMEKNPETNTWLAESDIKSNIHELSFAEIYIYAFYWSVTTMITVGYGDITPKNNGEIIITIIAMFFSCITFAYTTNTIWQVIQELNKNRFQFDNHVTAINRSMHDHKVNRKLNTKINAYIAHMWNADLNRDIEAEQIMIRRLAPALREQLLYDTLGLFLQKTPFFVDNFSQDFLRELATDIEEVRYSEGEVIFIQEDPQWDDLSLYFIQQGSVEIYLQQMHLSHHINILAENELFGWAGFVGGIRRTASAKCCNYSSFYKLNRAKFLLRLESYPMDKQIFHQLRDEYLFINKIEKFGTKCFLCDSHKHLAENCDEMHYVCVGVPQTNKQRNHRVTGFRRRYRLRFNSKFQQKDVARQAKYIREKSNMSDDDSREVEEIQDIARSELAQGSEVAELDIAEQKMFLSQEKQDDQFLMEQEQMNDDIDEVRLTLSPKDYRQKTQKLRSQPLLEARTKSAVFPRIQDQAKKKIPINVYPLNSSRFKQLSTPGEIVNQRKESFAEKRRITLPIIDLTAYSTVLSNKKSDKSDKQDQKLMLFNINLLSEQLQGQKLDLLNQIKEQLTRYKSIEEDQIIVEKNPDDYGDSDSDSQFSIDLQQNYTNYYPDSNLKNILNELKKNYRRKRRALKL